MGLVGNLKHKFEQVHIGNPLNSNKHILENVKVDLDTQIDKTTVIQNRRNHGVNLGALFVLEPWIYGELGDGNNEYDMITNLIDQIGENSAVEKLRTHYSDYIGKIDWDWLNNVGCTSLRVPIGYWHVNDGQFITSNVPFNSLKKFYAAVKPWDYFEELISSADNYNIGILIDLHGLPGGANKDSHSGYNHSEAKCFKTKEYVDLLCDQLLPFIVTDIANKYSNITGLQIVNETTFDEKGSGPKKYYARAVKQINQLNANLPVIISDGWWPEQWCNWICDENLKANVVIDSHVYRCFSNDDKAKDVETIIKELPKTINFPNDKADFMVGEFSCVLDQSSWDKTSNKDHNELVKKFGNAQIKAFKKFATFGWYFWTLQFKYGDGGEWGFVPMTNNGAIQKRAKNKFSVDSKQVDSLINEHKNYWKNKGSNFEHWRFEDGIKSAVDDIKAFDSFDNSRIGRIQSWTSRRRAQYIKEKGDSEFMWEWEQGYNRGLEAFNS